MTNAANRLPDNAKPLSEIARMIEQRADFAAFEEIELEEGVYEAEYYDKDGRKREIKIDPVSGEER